jgi:hypothetical protein
MRLEVAGHGEELARPPDRRKQLDGRQRPAFTAGGFDLAGGGERLGARFEEGQQVPAGHPPGRTFGEIHDPFISVGTEHECGSWRPIGTAIAG